MGKQFFSLRTVIEHDGVSHRSEEQSVKSCVILVDGDAAAGFFWGGGLVLGLF